MGAGAALRWGGGSEPHRAAREGDLPTATFTTLDGKPFSLDRVEGKVVLLNFWATWCPPCVTEFPSMVELARRSKGRIALVAVSQDKGPDEVSRFLTRFPSLAAAKKENPDIHVLLDANGSVASSQFAVLRLPESFVVDRERRIARKFVGPVDWLAPDVVAYFDSLSAK